MKTIRFFWIAALLVLLGTNAFSQSSYYYFNNNRVYLTENPFVRHIRLKPESVNDQKDSLRQSLCLYAKEMVFDTNQYVYFVRDTNHITDFENVVKAYDNIFSLNTCEYSLDSITILVPQRKVLVKLSDKRNLDSILTELNIEYAFVEKAPYNNNCYTIVLERDNALSTSVLLYNTGYFEYAEPDFLSSFQLLGYADNPYYSQQWSIHNDSININLLPAWEITTGSESIKTAIIDVGVDNYHEDLFSNMLPGYSAISSSFGLEAGSFNHLYESHGTYCAGIIAAENNNIGLVGVAHTSKLMSVKCADITPVGYRDMNEFYPYGHDHIYTSHLLDALDKSCNELEADVILLALTNRFRSDAVYDKFSEVCKNGRKGKGCVIVVSSGNNEMSEVTDTSMSFFARHPNVISVGAVSPTGLRAVNASIYGNYYFSSCYGDSLCVVAPGVHIPTTEVYSSYVYFSGTSTAAAHVAGIAALVLSVNPCLTWDEVKFIIESTCTKIRSDTYSYNNCSDHPNGSWNIEVGYGLVNAGAAVSLAEQMGGYIYVNDTLISATEIWDTIRFMNQDLTIDSLVTLTITDSVLIANGARIIVRPGGKLIVDGGTLTSACTGEMWQGIFVEGHRNLHQTEANQGTVVLRNGAVIENALRGIRTGAPGDNWNTTGGIVQCSNSTFHNNRKAVAFYPYADIVSGTTVRDNFSGFSNCTFTVDNDNLFAANNTSFDAHATLWDVKGVTFEGCTFTNATTAMTFDKGYAIKSIDAGFRVATLCDIGLLEPTSVCQCPENKATYSQFSGFQTAISASTSGNTYYVLVDEAQFSNNGTGIYISGNNHVTVTRNDFDMNSLPGTITEGTGLSLSGCTGYLVEENNFHRTSLSGPFPFEGICVTNSGTAANLLYRNDFSRLNKAVTVVGTNGGSQKPVGLVCSCNSFQSNVYDIYVAASSNMSPQQGSASAGADNQFSGTTASSLYNAGSYAITYYNSGTGIGLVPYNPTSNVTVWSKAAANSCQSTLCGSGNVLPPPGPIKSPDAGYLALKAQYDTLLSEFKSRGYADIVADPSEDIHSQADILSARLAFAQLGELERELHTRSNNAVRALLRDTLLDLPALESWFAATPGLSSRYSLAETEYLSGASNVLTLQGVSALLETEEERDEYDNYLAFNALKEALSGYLYGHADWPSATGTQIAELQRIADANTGRSSVMARGVLCFFFGICEEDLTPPGDMRAMQAGETSHAPSASTLSIRPNPTEGRIRVQSAGSTIRSVEVYDISGRQLFSFTARGTTADIDLSSLEAGVYLLRVALSDGTMRSERIVRK